MLNLHIFILFASQHLGWGGGRSPGAAEISDLWQRSSLCSKVRRGISAVPATLCYCYLEPSGLHRPGSQIWPGEITGLSIIMPVYAYLNFSFSVHVQTIIHTISLQLVSNAIQFLASVCERPHYKHLFEDQNTLTSICEKVIVPNMEFRSRCSVDICCLGFRPVSVLKWRQLTAVSCRTSGADEEAFEDNSEEYIRRDLEGSGKD